MIPCRKTSLVGIRLWVVGGAENRSRVISGIVNYLGMAIFVKINFLGKFATKKRVS